MAAAGPALEEALAPLREAFSGTLGDDAELFELAALVSDPRAPRQPAHPDTPFRPNDGAAIITAFVALQDIDEDMGPTIYLPGTHTREAHTAFFGGDLHDARGQLQLLRAYAPRASWRSACEIVRKCRCFGSAPTPPK